MLNRKMLIPKFIRDLLDMIRARRGGKQIIRTHRKIGRNEACRCGSGKRYKCCCYESDCRKGIR